MDPVAAPMEAIPKGIRYSEVIPKGIKAVPSFVDYLPSNGSTFSDGQVIRIPIQSYAQLLDTKHSMLSFDATVNATAADVLTFDAGGHGCIQRLRVLSASNQELERIDDYAHMVMIASDIIRSYGNYISVGGLAEGLSTSSQNNAVAQRSVTIAAGPTAQTTSFSLPLHISGVLGCLLSKYLPLPVINNGIILELTIAPRTYALRSSTANAVTSFSISNVRYQAALVTPSSDFLDNFRAIVARSGLVLSTTSFRNYVQQLSGGTNGTNTVKIVDSLKSVKSFFGSFRRNAILTNQAGYSITSRGRENLSSYFLRINNTPIPTAPVSCTGALTAANASTGGSAPTQAILEVYKSMARLGDSQVGFNLTGEVYTADDTTTLVNNQTPKFLIALDLEAFQGQAVLSGTSMFSGNTSEIQVVLTGTGGNACQFSGFLLYDMELVIDAVGNLNVNY